MLNKNIIFKSKILSYKNIIILISSFILIIIIAAFLGRIDRYGYISNFNLISSNNSEYKYNFKIKYYSKIFKNSDIYGVYPYLDNMPEYISYIQMDDRSGTPFGTLISFKELKYDDKIDNIKYYLMLHFNIFYYLTIIFLITMLCLSFYLINRYLKYKKNLIYKDYSFINKVEIASILLFAFQYWLLYPGYFSYWDTWRSILNALYNTSVNWDPVFVDLSIKFIDKIDFTMSFFFFINLFLWYCGIFFIIISLYNKFKNQLVILLLLISFILQIFISNIEYVKDNTATLYFIFSCSIIFLIIFIPMNNRNKNILKIISVISLIIAMLYRHNFIVTVYPILIWFTYDFLKNKNITNIKKYLFYFLVIMFFNAIILMSIFFIFPKIFIKDPTKLTSYGGIYLQIVGCVVPANDSSVIPQYWYVKDKNFNDVLEEYNKNPFDGVPYWEKIFLNYEIKDLKKIWIKSILKYPLNYFKHMINYTKNMWFFKYEYATYYHCSPDHIQDYINYPNNVTLFKLHNVSDSIYNTRFFKENKGIQFTELKYKIYAIIVNHFPNINVSIFIILSIILFVFTLFLLILKKTFRVDILIFSFSMSFSAVATAIIVATFTPSIVFHTYRYIYPVIPIAILSLIGFISFIYEIGGFKKFIKELGYKEK